jgi:hypothetical protein
MSKTCVPPTRNLTRGVEKLCLLLSADLQISQGLQKLVERGAVLSNKKLVLRNEKAECNQRLPCIQT